MIRHLLPVFFSISILVISGCISFENVEKSQAESEKKTEQSQGFIQAELSVFPDEVKPEKKVNAYVSLKNLREKEPEKVFVCLYTSNFKECKKTNLKTEGELEFSFNAPKIPKDMKTTESVNARIYILDKIYGTLEIPIIDENEYITRKRAGKTITPSSFSLENSFLNLQVEIKNEPIISKNGNAEFDFIIRVSKIGSGAIFNPEAFPSTPQLKEISFDDTDIAFIKINPPSALTINCDKEKTSEGYKIELFRGEDSIICKASLSDSSLKTERIYPVLFEIKYAYYFDLSSLYIIKNP